MSIRTIFNRQSALRTLSLSLVLASIIPLNGCGGFFHAITTTTTTNSGTGYDIVYVGKNGSTSFVGYALSSSTGNLTAVTTSAYSIGSAPLSMAITPSNAYLYVGTVAGIYGYSIAAGGGLTSLNSSAAIANTPATLGNGPISMDVSPDGDWLAVLTNNAGGSATVLVYQITTSTGLLTFDDSATVAVSSTAVMHTIKFSPNEDLLAATLGTSGTEVFGFTPSNGAITSSYVAGLTPTSSLYSDNAAVFSYAGTTLYLTRGGSAAALLAYPINATTGAITANSGQSILTGTNPTALSLNISTAATPYLYVTNTGDSTITGVAIGSSPTSMSALPNSPYSSQATSPYAIAYDNTGTYMLALNQSGAPDLVEYTIDTASATAGRLYVTASANTGLGVSSSNVGPGITMVTTH